VAHYLLAEAARGAEEIGLMASASECLAYASKNRDEAARIREMPHALSLQRDRLLFQDHAAQLEQDAAELEREAARLRRDAAGMAEGAVVLAQPPGLDRA
jgi:hypothetical protein